MIKEVIRSIKSKVLGWKIKHGYVARGRTNMGESTIKATTKMVARHIRNGKEISTREVINKKVTTAFVNDIVDNLIAESSAFGDYKYHDSGTGVGAESPSDVGLGTPCAEARTVGSQVEGVQTYEYKSVATHTYAGTFAITEHGLFNHSTGVTLMDRSVFSAINVVADDKIEFTFTIQFSAEA
jgi:hypothetical protein